MSVRDRYTKGMRVNFISIECFFCIVFVRSCIHEQYGTVFEVCLCVRARVCVDCDEEKK